MKEAISSLCSLCVTSNNEHIVAEQIDEIISVKNPPNCVGGIRVIIRTCYIFSHFAAPYEIHSYSVHLSECYYLVFYRTVHKRHCWEYVLALIILRENCT